MRVQKLPKMRTFPYWANAKTKCSHKFTVKAARGAGPAVTGRHGRDEVMVTTINTVVANLISSSIIERIMNINGAQK
jgi:hypothetical protein